jgi:tRNA pseudouridine38-40 synthase
VRLRVDLAYDGTAYAGWARQPGQATVQAVAEAALARILRVDVGLTVAGRTDTGVHAKGQVAHTDVPPDAWAAAPARLLTRLAAVLPPDVRVLGLAPAPDGFDARFSALSRTYGYRLTDSPAGADPLRRADTLAWRRPLDLAALQEASAALLGLRDFAAFCRRRAGGTTVRTLQRLDWRRDDEGVLVATVRADAFCHSMVRSLVGALLAVGEGRQPTGWPARLLAEGERSGERAVGMTVAPAHGLTLLRVDYPDDAELARRTHTTRALRPPLHSAAAPVHGPRDRPERTPLRGQVGHPDSAR